MTSVRHFGMAVHNITGIIFVVLLLVHMGLNRRALWNYISAKRSILLSRELLAAIALVAVSVVGFSLHAFHIH